MPVFTPATIGSLAFRLLLLRPDWKARTPSVSHRFDTRIGTGRTSIEERRPARGGVLLTQQIAIVANGAEQVRAWREGLAELGATMVGMPVWFDALPVARWGDRVYEPQQVLNFDPASGAFAIYAADELPGSPAYSHYAPLLIGRWENRPPAKALKKTAAMIEVKLVEASPWSCRIGVHSYGDGWSAQPDWKTVPEDVSEYSLEQLMLEGVAAREVGLDGINSAARWLQRGGFAFADRPAIRTALTHFVAMRGAWQSWSGLPAWMDTGAPTTGTPATYTARFLSDVLTLNFPTGSTATAQIGFLQELNTPTRAQALPGEAILYRLDYEHDPENPELLTSWDQPLVGTEGTFQPHQISHPEIIRSLKPQNQRAEVSAVFAAGSLLDDWNRGRLFGRVILSVWACDPDDVAGTRGKRLFRGPVTDVLPEGNMLRVTAQYGGDILSSKLASWEYGPNCRTHVFSPECGLAEGDHDSAGTAARADLSTAGTTLTVHGVTGWGGPAYAAEWFAGGILRTGMGRQTQLVTITSSAMSGEDLVLQLQRPLWPDMIAAGGQAVTLLPGCGLQYEADCGTKFDNQENFRGNPYMPDFLEQVDPGQPKTPKK